MDLHLMGTAEIAELLGVTRTRVDQLARQKGFPDPVAVLQAGRIWDRKDVERWARQVGRLPEAPST
jgi:predicted DNA-binding transcriptional regulator AlpA